MRSEREGAPFLPACSLHGVLLFVAVFATTMHPTQAHTTQRRGDLRRLLRRVALGREREGERAQAAPPAWPWSLPKLAEGGAAKYSAAAGISTDARGGNRAARASDATTQESQGVTNELQETKLVMNVRKFETFEATEAPEGYVSKHKHEDL